MAVSYCFVKNPWNVISAIEACACWHDHIQPDAQPWSRFMVSKSSSFVCAIGSGEPFPSRLVEMNGCAYRVTELPGPALSGDKAFGDIFYVHPGSDNSDPIHIACKYQKQASKQKQTPESVLYEDFFDHLLDEMIFVIRNGLNVDLTVSIPVYWGELLSLLKHDYGKDPAKHALIVELAKVIIQPLDRITGNPKKVLKRTRDQERIQSVREVDKHCLVDLARRPGTSLPEKAGRRQRILSIKRYESHDILENKVFLHCCELLMQSSKRYISAHHAIEGSARKKLVETLYQHCKRLAEALIFRDVSRLRNPCRYPNYTLLQNIYYSKVWRAYTQLLRNEQLRDSLWRWSRRLWSDYLALFLSDTILSWCQSIKSPVLVEIGEKIVQANIRPHHGKWLLTDVMPGPFVIGNDCENPGTLYTIDGSSSSSLGEDAQCLSSLNADYVFVWLSPEGNKALPVYAHLMMDVGDAAGTDQELNETARELIAEIEKFNIQNSSWNCIGAWVLIGPQRMGKRQHFDPRVYGQLTCWQSHPSTDPLKWHELQGDRFDPLDQLVGIGDHVSRS